jgi:glutamate-ammonia-ligase adenylyltransferase
MESERLPRGADPKTHLKLGHGGLSDVEWTVQLLQLCHAAEVPGLRTTSTLEALTAAREAGLLSTPDADALATSWQLASRLRNAGVLWRGRPVEALPSDLRDADGIGRIIGREPGTGAALAEDYRRLARRARSAVVSNFFESR